MLKVTNLVTRYDNIRALNGISFEVKEGEIVTLIGGNGAGKTTTLNSISGVVRPASGSISFMNQEISRLFPHEIVRLGIAQSPEGRQVIPGFTVVENLNLGAYNRKDNQVKADLEMVYGHFPRLKERQRQYAGTLSGGEQQMLAIGRALMARPRLLLLDEPSLGLSPMMAREIYRIIKEIHARGSTVLLVEENAYAALKLADRAYILETGAIVLSGLSSELIRDQRVKSAYLGMH